MSFISFDDFFLHVHGFAPYAWQRELNDFYYDNGSLPETISVPTGMGKTSVADVFVYNLARAAFEGDRGRIPHKLVLAVDRQSIVDGISQHVQDLCDHVCNAGTDSPLYAMRVALESLNVDDSSPALRVSTLHGSRKDLGAFRSVVGAEIIATTTTQAVLAAVGESPAVGRRTAAIPAAIVSHAQIVVDEPHLSPHHVSVLQQLSAMWAAPVSVMGATVDSSNSTAGTRLDFDVSKEGESSRAAELFYASKPVDFVFCDSSNSVASTMVEQAEEMLSEVDSANDSVAVVVSNVALAQSLVSKLSPVAKRHGFTVRCLTGQLRAVDRLTAQELNAPGHLFVATQVVEAGVDFSVSRMMSDMCPLPALRQRLGRLSRYGEQTGGRAVVVCADNGKGVYGTDAAQAVYGDCLQYVPKFVSDSGVSHYDMGIYAQEDFARKVVEHNGISEFDLYPDSPIPAYVAQEHVDTLFASTTGYKDVSGIVGGVEEDDSFQCSVAWRSVLSTDNQLTPFPAETVSMSVDTARKIFESANKRISSETIALKKVGGSWVKVDKPRDITPQSFVVFSTVCGGLTDKGVVPGDKKEVDDASLYLALQSNAGFKSPFVVPTANSANFYIRKSAENNDNATNTVGTVDTEDFMATVSHVAESVNKDMTDREARDYIADMFASTLGVEVEVAFSDYGHVMVRAVPTQDKKVSDKVLPLDVHLSQTGYIAGTMCDKLGLSGEVRDSVVRAAFTHDVGKAHPKFQKMLGALPGEILAKSTGRVSMRNVHPPMHDLIGAHVVEEMYGDLLAAYLVAAHHGATRTVSSRWPQGCLQWVHARKQLEQEHGVYGLLYLESIVRSADWEASAYPDVNFAVGKEVVQAVETCVSMCDTGYMDDYIDSVNRGGEVDTDGIVPLLGSEETYIPAWYAVMGVMRYARDVAGVALKARWRNGVAEFAAAGEDDKPLDVDSVRSLVSRAADYMYAELAREYSVDMLKSGHQKVKLSSGYEVSEVYRRLAEVASPLRHLFTPCVQAFSAGRWVMTTPHLASNGNVFTPDCTIAVNGVDSAHSERIVDSLMNPDDGWEVSAPVAGLNSNGASTVNKPALSVLGILGSLFAVVSPRGLGSNRDNGRALPIPDFWVDVDMLTVLALSPTGRCVVGLNDGQKAQKINPGFVDTCGH